MSPLPLQPEEIRANLERAREALQAARVLSDAGLFDAAASRAYYAAFYAATALLLYEGRGFRKHTGVLGAIHQHFVRTGRLDQRWGKTINRLFELRGIGDYGGLLHVPREEAENALEEATGFVGIVETMTGLAP